MFLVSPREIIYKGGECHKVNNFCVCANKSFVLASSHISASIHICTHDCSSANRYVALLIPPSFGAVTDLANNKDLAEILNHFIQEKSKFI